MNTFLLQQIIFISTVFTLLIVPGWFFLRALFHRDQFAPLERFVLSLPISFSLITLVIIATNAFGFELTKTNMLIAISTVLVPIIVAAIFIKHKKPHGHTEIFQFSKKQALLIAALIVFTIVVKGIFLTNTIFPTSTDLGHHMFWVEKIVKDEKLPIYKKIQINPETNTFTEPERVADFIVGEHITFAVVKVFTEQSIISTFPSLILFVINIFTILTIFILTRRLFQKYRYGAQVAILTLLFIGPLWTISGAQAKFVSGGAIGNIIGNLLIPVVIYFIYRAFTSKKASLLVPAIITITALAYTHHLSAFIFGYVFIFSLLAFIILQRNGWNGYKRLLFLLKNPYVLPLLVLAILSLLFLVPPSYINQEAITSSVGSPSKSTRTGVPFSQLMYMLGEARFVFGLIGLFVISVFYLLRRLKYKKLLNISKRSLPMNIYGAAFTLGWSWALLCMSLAPHILKVNIISTRIATYGAFPLAILSGFAIMWLIGISIHNKKLTMPQLLLSITLFIIITFTFVSGARDNATTLSPAPKTNKALQTFHAGDYMSEKFTEKIADNKFWLLKDHNDNVITADTWLKTFFAHDYSYPLSRSHFGRYERNPNRETCTLNMISAPRTEFAKECFDNLNVHAVLVNTKQDAGQFSSQDNFYRIYQNNELSLFIRK